MKLREAELIEEEYRKSKLKEWRDEAASPNHVTFLFGDIIINEVIFSDYFGYSGEKDNLELFPDDMENLGSSTNPEKCT